jgi:hypothetical protein
LRLAPLDGPFLFRPEAFHHLGDFRLVWLIEQRA